MERYLKSRVLSLLEKEKQHFPENIYKHLLSFFYAYGRAVTDKNLNEEQIEKRLSLYLDLVKNELTAPTKFGLFHKRDTSPLDFYEFATSTLAVFVDKEDSVIAGKENIATILSYLAKGENVFLLANHQAEADPALLGVLLEDLYPGLIKDMIAIAGARVTTDPVTIPFTKGQNALCVYSKKYFDMHQEKKKEMQQHNSAAMLTLRHQLNEGGKLVYVAPSGGRDRKDEMGNLAPALFDPDSIELMRVVGAKAKSLTHYFPLALYTYPLAPPPEKIKKEIGEQREMSHTPVHINFGKEYKMSAPNQEEKKEKVTFRQNQARSIHKKVTRLYEEITT